MAEGTRKVNWFAIWVSAAVVVALVLVTVLVVSLNNAGTDPGDPPQSAVIEEDTGAILVGEGPDRLDTYIDFMCPICNQFEQVYGESIQGLVDDGTITLGIHPISILDRYSQGTEYSTRAANAMYCVAVADADAAVPFMQAMFANQPEEQSEGLTDDQILQVAASVDVTGIDACVTGQEYAGFVTAMTAETPLQPGASGIGTPTIAVNGEAIANADLPQPDQLATLFD